MPDSRAVFFDRCRHPINYVFDRPVPNTADTMPGSSARVFAVGGIPAGAYRFVRLLRAAGFCGT